MPTQTSSSAAPTANQGPQEKGPAKGKSPTKLWRKLTPGDARQALSTSVHWYSKPVNTNAAPAGVRVGAGEPDQLRAVCFSTTRLNRRVTTYTCGAPKMAPFSQAMSVIEGVATEEYKDVDLEQQELVLREVDVLDEYFAITTLDPRLRQLFVPSQDPTALGDLQWIAVTPLVSAPFSFELQKRIEARYQDLKTRYNHLPASSRSGQQASVRRLPTLRLQIGGSKPQNVGRHTDAVGTLLRFEGPQEDQELRKALAIIHRGLEFDRLVSRELLQEFSKRWDRLSERLERSMQWREELERFTRELAREALEKADSETDAAARTLRIYAKAKGEDDQTGLDAVRQDMFQTMQLNGVDDFALGLSFEQHRNRAWPKTFAKRLVGAMQSFVPEGFDVSLASADEFLECLDWAQQEAL